jgi:glutathione synthase/RimK-type ligase-like ATP-grasp enzyme
LIDVALVTYADLLDLFPDDRPLEAALRSAGIETRAIAWDDPSFDWMETRIAFLRSPWDYYRRPDEFLAWAGHAAAATRLVNPLAVVRWNLHKGYLLDLERRGVPVVPTELLRRSRETTDFAALISRRGWNAGAVVKPAISADSWETVFVPPGDPAAGQRQIDRLIGERDLLVQPFLASVEDHGERCLVFLDGDFSHAVRKNALTLGGRWTGLPEGAPVEAAADELATARAVVAAAGLGDALYARVDLTRDERGRPLLLELEATEPTLFLADAPAGLARLVDAIRRELD